MDWEGAWKLLRPSYDQVISAVREACPWVSARSTWHASDPDARYAGHFWAAALFDDDPPEFDARWDLVLTFNCAPAGSKDTFYKPDGTWAFPYRYPGYAVGFDIFRPSARDPDGEVDILAQLSPVLLPGDPSSIRSERTIWEYLQQVGQFAEQQATLVVEVFRQNARRRR
jgi:hypothetical protein